jgi:hypothetical protein
MSIALAAALRQSQKTMAGGYVELAASGWDGVMPTLAGRILRRFTKALSRSTEIELGVGRVEINNWRAWWHNPKGDAK